jgi:hypothetical protein
MIVIIAVVVLYCIFCTCAKHRLDEVGRQVSARLQFGDNYLSVGLLCLTIPRSSSDGFTVTDQFTRGKLKCNVFNRVFFPN